MERITAVLMIKMAAKKVVLLAICMWSASIVATCIAAHFALCRAS